MKNMNMIRVIFFILFLLCVMVLNSQSQAQEDFDKVPDDEWPTQVIFDTVNVCYNGTLRWVALGNPNLMNTPPPYHISRLMAVHCFCVLDKVRTQYKYRAYVDFISEDNKLAPKLIPKLFMAKSLKCIKEHGTLAGLIILDEEALKGLDEYSSDNKSKRVVPPNNNSGKSDSPEQPEELPKRETPLLNF